jgi:hypothetical protein
LFLAGLELRDGRDAFLGPLDIALDGRDDVLLDLLGALAAAAERLA